jgi:hypothetical protein
MRIRIPRRCLLLGILLCSLALATSAPEPTFAKPIPWNDTDGPPLNGDGDGSVVKGGSLVAPLTATPTETARTAKVTMTVSGMWRTYLTVLRLGHGWRWIW